MVYLHTVFSHNVGINLPKVARADLGGTHKEPVPRERPDGEFPPGVNCYSKEPLSANPLLQVVLPQGFTHENRRSKGVSFKGSDLVFAKGTSRTRQQAEMACMSWAWSWWESLAPEKRSAILDSIQEPSAKKRKTSWADPGVREKVWNCIHSEFIENRENLKHYTEWGFKH